MLSGSKSEAPANAALAGYQRKFLRGLAHDLKPVVQVGHAGVTPEVVRAATAAQRDHELIKVRLLRPEDKAAFSAAVAEGTGSTLCGLVGHTVILYKPHPEAPVIRVPQRREG